MLSLPRINWLGLVNPVQVLLAISSAVGQQEKRGGGMDVSEVRGAKVRELQAGDFFTRR